MIKDLLNTKMGQILLSIILGLGLATLFKKVCKDNGCIVIKGPPRQDVEKYYYKIDDDCYKYTPQVTDCEATTVATSE